MLRFQRLTSFLLTILVLSVFISLPNLYAQPAEESQRAGSQVTIPVNQLQDLNSVKLLQYYPGQPYAKCLVPGELFAAGGLLDMARIQAGERFTVNFPNASINFESEGVRQEATGYATVSISGLILEGTELLAVCNIGYRGVRADNNNYTISVKKEGAAQAPVAVTQVYAEMAPLREEPTVAVVNNTVAYNPGTIRTDSSPGEDCPECDPPVGEGSTGTETPPIGEGSLGDGPRSIGEGEIGEGPLPGGRGDFEPVDPGEIDRDSVDTGNVSDGPNPNDKVFVAQGTEAAVTTDPDFNSQNLVAMSGGGCSLAVASQPLETAWVALFILAGIIPTLSRRKRVNSTHG